MFNAEAELEQEQAQREAVVVEAAREWARADDALQRRNEAGHGVAGALARYHVACRSLHAAVAALEELIGPLQEQTP